MSDKHNTVMVTPLAVIDEAATGLSMVLPDAWVDDDRHPAWGLLSAAVRLDGDASELRVHEDLAWLVEPAPAVVARPWRDLEDAIRDALDGQERKRAVRAVQNLRAALREGAEDAAFEFADLAGLNNTPTPAKYAPGPLAHRVVSGNGLTTLAGKGDSGKSWLAQGFALDAMRAGYFTVHLDWEQGGPDARTGDPGRAISRYLKLGSSIDEMHGMLGFKWRPGALSVERLHDLAGDYENVFVLVDSFAKAAAAAGIGSTDWAAHGEFVSMLNAFAVDRDCPLVLIDHKGRDSGSLAGGAASKFDAATAQWSVATKGFSATKRGAIDLTNDKDRDSAFDAKASYGTGGRGEDRNDLERVGTAAEVASSEVARSIREALRDAPLSGKALEQAVGGKATRVREERDRMVKVGELVKRGEGRSPSTTYEVAA